MPTLKGFPIICIQEMAEEVSKNGHAKLSVDPSLKTHFPLQFTEWRLKKLMNILVPHFSSRIYIHSKKWGVFKTKILFLTFSSKFLAQFKNRSKIKHFLNEKDY